MKLMISLIIVNLFLPIGYSQTNIYEGLNGEKISKESFFKIKRMDNDIYAYRIQNDTIINFIYKNDRNFKGVLDEQQLMILKEKYPFKIKERPIVIQYFPGVDDCSQHIVRRQNEFVNFFKNKLRKLKGLKTNVYHVYRSNKDIEILSQKLKWINDEKAFIENLFFKYHFPCGSYVVINNNGEYKGFFGEYDTNQIISDFDRLK